MAMKMGDDDDEIVAEINMTPLIDIMLVLLILFMVTSSVSLDSGLDIDLPKTTGKSEGGNKGPEAVIVSLNKDGVLMVQGDRVDFSTLEAAIKDALTKAGESLVILEGDQKATLGKAIEIMDYAKRAGALKFAIATEQGQ